MTLKSLVTGVAALAVAGGVAAGVTYLASPTSTMSQAPEIVPVVWDVPMPAAPAPELEGPLLQTLQALGGPGLSASKAPYVQGGIGRFESKLADSKLRAAQAEGKFPLSFTVANIDANGPIVTADVTATAATGGTASQNIQFVAGPSPTGWQMSKASLMALLSAVG
ncbi:Low molecular weight antigen CFP2 (Low molecular weight protein antigen 2) (CFP-2) [Mycolicibacterium phlei]|nr:hypothetical protein [Mycolicibacterium phlei]AMO61543.1 Low molecular weight antigen MTB12 precursor [Mycolicibacterium phlei]KXW76100.1 hypothetical protein JL15_18740 [Mycolicibacterium phlei DSM 43071]STZ18647.1 Low molecular weight antigen CFP2 (Low molecular weight protein antigen 2) (CFP-2) [Mycolicibacterium phlei]VEG09651.1 Low molecular weight antigen CFP2 (Low molecular weight protein antigen 2) (CFP-2) [Mycobacteroides chelonae]